MYTSASITLTDRQTSWAWGVCTVIIAVTTVTTASPPPHASPGYHLQHAIAIIIATSATITFGRVHPSSRTHPSIEQASQGSHQRHVNNRRCVEMPQQHHTRQREPGGPAGTRRSPHPPPRHTYIARHPHPTYAVIPQQYETVRLTRSQNHDQNTTGHDQRGAEAVQGEHKG